MKRYLPAIIIVFCIALLAAPLIGSGAPGQLVRETGNRTEVIQAFSGAPTTAASSAMTGTKAFKNLSTGYSTGYRALKVSCTDGAGANLPCRFAYNGATASTYLPITSGERTFIVNPDVTYIRFGKYSASTSSTVTLSSERM